jgi:hypothetical protein
MRGPIATLLALAVLLGLSTAAQAAHAEAAAPSDRRLAILAAIERLRHETWHWERLIGKPRTAANRRAEISPAVAYQLWVLELWRERAEQARLAAHHPPRLQDWLCIHRREGAWNDPDAPYFGGLQMNLEFQRTYGPELLREKGTADHWTPLEQIWVALRAHRSGRGFHPWPNTARACGLI